MTGTITPKESGDLVISLYAMRRLAEKRGLNSQKSYAVNYEALKQMCSGTVPAGDCPTRVIAHINGNHFVLITKVTDTEISYTDPGAGAESALEVVTVSKEEFLLTWLDPRNPDAGVGYIMSLQTPVQGRVLTATEEMSVRGAFFGWLKKAFDFVVNVFKGVFEFVKSVVVGLVQGIWTAIQGFVDVLHGLFTWNMDLLLHGLKEIVVEANVEIVKGLLMAPVHQANAFERGLVSLGIPESVAKTVLSGANIAIGVTAVAAGIAGGNPVLVGAGISMAGSGTSDILVRHADISPTTANLISVGAQAAAVLSGGFVATGSISQSLSYLASSLPNISSHLAVEGLQGIGSALGLDPRLTGLLSIPISAGVGAVTGSLVYANSINPTSVFASIKNGLAAGAKSIGLEFGSGSGLFGPLSSGSVTSSVESVLGREGLFSSILDTVKTALLSPVNVVGGVVESLLDSVTGFNTLIEQKGITGAFEELATSIFSRKTLEAVVRAGGMNSFMGTAAKIAATFAGVSAEEWKFGSTAGSSDLSLFFNTAGALIGKKENSVTQSGTFGSLASGKWGLVNGAVSALLAGGYVFAADVANGQLTNGAIYNDQGQKTVDLKAEGGSPYIFIDGRDNSPAFWNAVMEFLPIATKFYFEKGDLKETETRPVVQTPAPENAEYYYLLANGVNNSANKNPLDDLLRKVFSQTDETSQPDYFINLRDDLGSVSGNQIQSNDVIMSSLYWNIPWDIKDWGEADPLKWADRVKDVLRMLLGTQTPLRVMSPLVWDLRTDIEKAAAEKSIDLTRPVIALGYSGGFPVLAETVYQMGLNLKGLVGVGASLVSLDNLIEVISKLGAVFESIAGGVGTVIGDAIQKLFSKIPIVSQSINFVIDEVIGKLVSGSVEAIKTVQKYFVEGIEALKVQNLVNQAAMLGVRDLSGSPVDAVLNIYGADDQLVKWGISGAMSSVAGFTSDKVLDIEIRSNDPAIKADHFIYMHEIRTDGTATQQAFDDAAADFVADLLVNMRNKSKTEIIQYLQTQYSIAQFHQEGNKFVFYAN